MKRQNVRSLLLVAGMIIYLLIGAAIFESLESTNEERERGKLEREKLELMKKYNLTENDWNLLTDHIVRFIPHKSGLQWKFAGAIYFSTTVITTIGYGHCTPKTNWGKIVCMVYALLGIPLNLVTFQSIGERLNTFTTFLLCTVRRRIKSQTERSDANVSRKRCTTSNHSQIDSKRRSYEFNPHFLNNDKSHLSAEYQNGLLRTSSSKYPYNKLNVTPKIYRNAVDKHYQITDLHSCMKNVKISSKIVGNKNNWSLNDFLSSSFTSKAETTDTHLICVTTSISTVFVAGGAYAFSRYEGWSYLDSLYFCIITLTTVGFGDLVALQKDKVLQDKPGYVTFNILFILSGLAVVSAAMNLLVLRFLTMNTEDEKRDKMLESFNAEAKVATNNIPCLLTNSSPESNRKKFMTLAGLLSEIKMLFVSSKSHSPLLKPPRYRVTRAPTENVHHLIDINPVPHRLSSGSHNWAWRKAKHATNSACLCRSKLLTV